MADAVRSKGTFDAFILRWRTTSRSWNCACNSGKLQLFPIASRNVLNFNWIWLQQELDSQPKNDPTVVQDQEQRQLINLLPTAVTNFKPFTTTTVRYGWIDLKLHSFHRIFFYWQTILSTSTLTVSTPTTVKCIASAAFSANSTSACARRRREIEELLAHSHKTAIDPAPPSYVDSSITSNSKLLTNNSIILIQTGNDRRWDATCRRSEGDKFARNRVITVDSCWCSRLWPDGGTNLFQRPEFDFHGVRHPGRHCIFVCASNYQIDGDYRSKWVAELPAIRLRYLLRQYAHILINSTSLTLHSVIRCILS